MLANCSLVELSLYQDFNYKQVEEWWELLGQLVELVAEVLSQLKSLFTETILKLRIGKTVLVC